MARLTKLDRMSEERKKELIQDYRDAPADTEFPSEVIALVYHLSLSWLQKKRCEGGGIPFSKPSAKTILYKKQDVIQYMEDNRLKHTG